MEPAAGQIDRRRVRIGFGVVCAVFVVGLVLVTVVDDPIGRAVMLGVCLTAFVRAALLSRAIRRDAAAR